MDRRAAHRYFRSFILRRGAIQVEENEARPVALAQILDDLVFSLLVIHGRIEAEAIVHEAQLRAEFIGLGELRPEQRIRPGKAISISAEGRRLRLESRSIRIRRCIAPDLGIRRSQLARHVFLQAWKCIAEDEARRDRRIEERVLANGNRRRPIVPSCRRHVQVVLEARGSLTECAHQASLRDDGAVRLGQRVVDRDEIRIEEVDAFRAIDRRFLIENRVSNQTAQRQAAGRREHCLIRANVSSR